MATLRDWANRQYIPVRRHKKYPNSYTCPDTPALVDRRGAWLLCDYVASVQNGVIYFSPKDLMEELR